MSKLANSKYRFINLILKRYERGRSNSLRRMKPYEETEVKMVRPIANQHKLLCEMYVEREEGWGEVRRGGRKGDKRGQQEEWEKNGVVVIS